ncbi:hypothetical protein H0H81_004625, partial [Sphagnurus paluster]
MPPRASRQTRNGTSAAKQRPPSRRAQQPTTANEASTRKRPASPSLSQPKATKKSKALPRARNTTVAPSRALCRAPAMILSDHEPIDEGTGIEASEPVVSGDKDENRTEPCYSDEDLGDDGLEGLDPRSLQTTLATERLHWAVTGRTICHSGSAHQNNEDNSNTEPGEIDTDGDHDLLDEFDDEAPVLSKRALAHQAEKPEWRSNTLEASESSRDTSPTTSVALPSAAATAALDVNASWPVAAHYVPPQHGKRNMPLLAQPAPVYTLIKAGINKVVADGLFLSAYPDVLTIEDYYRHLLNKTAEDLNLTAISTCLKTDTIFFEQIGRIFSCRLSALRSSTKKTTSLKVEIFYGLDGTPAEIRKTVKDLISTGDYIFPKNQNGSIERMKAFKHAMIISSVRDYYFSAARGGLASHYFGQFGSSILSGPAVNEKELPLPMLCMISTAIHAALDDWSTGFYRRTEFNADTYEDVYRGHELFLNTIRSKKPLAYHRLMADLFKEVS